MFCLACAIQSCLRCVGSVSLVRVQHRLTAALPDAQAAAELDGFGGGAGAPGSGGGGGDGGGGATAGNSMRTAASGGSATLSRQGSSASPQAMPEASLRSYNLRVRARRRPSRP